MTSVGEKLLQRRQSLNLTQQQAVDELIKRLGLAQKREHTKANCPQTISLGLYKLNPQGKGFKTVREGGLRFYSRDFQSPGTFSKMGYFPQKQITVTEIINQLLFIFFLI
jgi:hypothetical protein